MINLTNDFILNIKLNISLIIIVNLNIYKITLYLKLE